MRSRSPRLILWFLAALAAVAFLFYMTTDVIQKAWYPLAPRPPASVSDVLFYLLASLAVTGAAGVAFSKNVLYSSVGLLMALLGAGSLYVFLSADFVAVAQLLVYIGGVLVLILFAVMLTNRIAEVKVSNPRFGLFGGLLLLVAVLPVLVAVVALTPWPASAPASLAPTTEAIGHGLLTRWLLPFEVASLVLLATLIGAVVIARKEVKAD